ncbi:EpsG family protein [Pantoea osteomyelitidis]|uniref:EpsG family protein n=1 Tax=Pantoea osteomyelitidis TaxID=3230026 RepID=A0ABW7PTL6_9GAMM
MAIYWYISIFISALALVEIIISDQERTKEIRLYLFWVAVVILFTFGGIRGLGTGLDDSQYRDFYNLFMAKIPIEGFVKTLEDFRYEPMIYIIAGAVRIFTKNADIFMYVFCMIAVSVNAWYFKKLSPLPLVSLALYSAHLFINKDMNQIRFGLSSAFFLGFLYHLTHKNRAGMIRLFILSFISHATAIVAILIPLALIVKKNKYIPAIIVLASIPMAFIGSHALIALLSSHIGALGERAMGYANQDSTQEQGIFTLSNLKNIMFVFIFSALLLNDKIRNISPEKFNFFYIMVLAFAIGSGLRLALQDYASGGRLANYLLQIEPVLIAACIYQTRKVLKLAAVGVTMLMVVYYLYYNTISSKQSITGYTVSQSFQLFK